VPHLGTDGLGGRRHEVGVDVVLLTLTQRSARGDQLAPHGDDDDARTRADEHLVDPTRGEDGHHGRVQHRALVHEQRALGDVRPLVAHVLAAERGGPDGDALRTAVSDRRSHDGVGTDRKLLSDPDPPRRHRRQRIVADPDLAVDGEPHGGTGGGAADVGRPDGVAVDRGRLEGRHWGVGKDVLADLEPDGVDECHAERHQRGDKAENELAMRGHAARRAEIGRGRR